MKCNEAEKWVLLQDSGECASHKSGALAAHLHDCEPCRRFQHALMESRNAFETLAEPPEAIVNTVKREIRKRVPKSKKAEIIYWKPVLAVAASVMIALGLFFTVFRPDRVGLELVMDETQLFDTSSQVVSVMYSGLSEDDLAFNFLMTYEGGS